MDLLIKNGLVLSMDENLSVRKASIAVEDGKIKRIRKDLSNQGAEEVLDAGGKLVMPGIVLPHCHFQSIFLPSIGGEVSSGWSPLECTLTKEEVVAGTGFACGQLLSSGVTFAVNILSVKGTPAGILDEVSNKMEEMGMRGLVGVEIWDGGSGSGSKFLREQERFFRRHHSTKVVPLVSVRASSSEEILECARELADRHAARFSVRVSKTPEEYYLSRQRFGEEPVERLSKRGWLDERTLLSHFTYRVTEKQLELVQKNGGKIVHTPFDCIYTEKLPPLMESVTMGIGVALGTDEVFDVFEFLRLVCLQYRWMGKHIPASKLLEMVTSKAAELCGVKDAGTLEEGKSADIIILDLPPAMNLYEQVLWRASSGKVETVISGGRIVKKHKKLLVEDEAKLEREFNRLVASVSKRVSHGSTVS
ncbi:MAG: amidohydrolase family protein [Candidatus Hadarchaeales archaeon]